VSTVLVVGERPEQANALALNLGILGVEAIPCARDWKLAVRSFVEHRASLILMDGDTSEKCRECFDMVRELSDVPIVVRGLTSNTDLVVSYLERGAVDVVSKATPAAVLVAKINAVIRAEASPASGVVVAGDLAIDLTNRIVLKSSTEISLTPIEFRLLSVLAQNFGRSCKRDDLLKLVWGEDFTQCKHYVRIYIGYLRQKLEDNPGSPRLILNDWGYGYRLTAPKETGLLPSRLAALRPAHN
jgi:two-component system KDP operon response regulator KdpE